jgi:hypothetical protein
MSTYNGLAVYDAESFNLAAVEVVATHYTGFGDRIEYLPSNRRANDLTEVAAMVGMELERNGEVIVLHIGPECVEQADVKIVLERRDCMLLQICFPESQQLGEKLGHAANSDGFDGDNGICRIVHEMAREHSHEIIDVNQWKRRVNLDFWLHIVRELVAECGDHGIVERTAEGTEDVRKDQRNKLSARCPRGPFFEDAAAGRFGAPVGIVQGLLGGGSKDDPGRIFASLQGRDEAPDQLNVGLI